MKSYAINKNVTICVIKSGVITLRYALLNCRWLIIFVPFVFLFLSFFFFFLIKIQFVYEISI
jgi:hypothetical protein